MDESWMRLVQIMPKRVISVWCVKQHTLAFRLSHPPHWNMGYCNNFWTSVYLGYLALFTWNWMQNSDVWNKWMAFSGWSWASIPELIAQFLLYWGIPLLNSRVTGHETWQFKTQFCKTMTRTTKTLVQTSLNACCTSVSFTIRSFFFFFFFFSVSNFHLSFQNVNY